MAARNLTIQLDEDLIREAKVLAAEQGMSVSAMVSRDLREKLSARAWTERARRAAVESMAEAAASGRAAPHWRRDELYDRR
jgi:predicted transcriptional regulator